MNPQLEKVCSQVLMKITPSLNRRKHVQSLAQKLIKKIENSAKEADLRATIRVEGSIAKNTWLSDDPDIDIFVCLPPTTPQEIFETTCLEIAKKATAGYDHIERYAEHPYLESIINNIRVNIVPCYEVKRGKWLSSTDRTPFHTDYVKPLLNKRLCGEIRLLKQFMKGIAAYGGEIKTGGFSGYLCELLTLHYGSFIHVLTSAVDWRNTVIIDLEGYYQGKKQEIKSNFNAPVIIVDPVDKKRNAAAAVKEEKRDEFVAAARAFLKEPKLRFFYPPETEILKPPELLHTIEKRGSTIVFILFGQVDAPPDVLWGQLYKSRKAICRMVKQEGFEVIRDQVWSNEMDQNMVILELENRFLPRIKRHFGPPIKKKAEAERFLQKYRGNAHTLSGPRIEEGRWRVDIERANTDVVALLRKRLRTRERDSGIADLVSKALVDSTTILINEEVTNYYSANSEFAKFLVDFLAGKPKWLT